MPLADCARNYGVEPGEGERVRLAQATILDADLYARYSRQSLTWLAMAGGYDLEVRTNLRLLDIACAPEASQAHRDLAVDCLLRIERWDTDLLERLTASLTECPGTFWPHRLLDSATAAAEITRVWPELAGRLRRTADSCLLGSQKRCDQDIRQMPALFVAHPFISEITDDLRDAVAMATAGIGGYEVLYADKIQKDGTLSCKICMSIRQSAVSLFDLTSPCMDAKESSGFCPKARANPNVALELGLAFAYRKPTLLFAMEGCDPPADIAGHTIHRFVAYKKDLPLKLKSGVTGLLQT